MSDVQPRPRPQRTSYTVRRGDNLDAIASRHGVKWRDLARLNGMSDPDQLSIGQSLRLPGAPAVVADASAATTGGTPAEARAVNRGFADKMNRLGPYTGAMSTVAGAQQERFSELGLEVTPEIMMATAMQEASPTDPTGAVSFDNGMGLMQITPYRGKLTGNVADAIGYNNNGAGGTRGRIRNSNYKDPHANLTAGALTMQNKASHIQQAHPKLWEGLNQDQRWRLVMYAYNAGQGAASKSLANYGRTGEMSTVSRWKDPRGRWQSHDYTKEWREKLDFVERFSPFESKESRPSAEPPARKAQPKAVPQEGVRAEAKSTPPGPGAVADGGWGGQLSSIMDRIVAGEFDGAQAQAAVLPEGGRAKSSPPATLDAPIIDQHRLNHERNWAFCGLATLQSVLAQQGTDVDLGSRGAIERFKQGIYIPGQGSSGTGMARRMRENGLEDAAFTTGGSTARIVEMLDAGKTVPTGFTGMSGTVEEFGEGGNSSNYGHLKKGSRHARSFGESGHWSSVVGYEGKAESPTHFYVNDTDTGARLKMSAAEFRTNTSANKKGGGVWMIGY